MHVHGMGRASELAQHVRPALPPIDKPGVNRRTSDSRGDDQRARAVSHHRPPRRADRRHLEDHDRRDRGRLAQRFHSASQQGPLAGIESGYWRGVFGTIYDVGDALGPITAGLLVATVGYARMFQIMAFVGFAMAVVFAVASRTRPAADLAQAT